MVFANVIIFMKSSGSDLATCEMAKQRKAYFIVAASRPSESSHAAYLAQCSAEMSQLARNVTHSATFLSFPDSAGRITMLTCVCCQAGAVVRRRRRGCTVGDEDLGASRTEGRTGEEESSAAGTIVALAAFGFLLVEGDAAPCRCMRDVRAPRVRGSLANVACESKSELSSFILASPAGAADSTEVASAGEAGGDGIVTETVARHELGGEEELHTDEGGEVSCRNGDLGLSSCTKGGGDTVRPSLSPCTRGGDMATLSTFSDFCNIERKIVGTKREA